MLRWKGHNVILIYDFTKPGWKENTDMQGYIATFSTEETFGSGCPNWGSPKQVVNSDEYVCVPMGSIYSEGGIKMGIINWRETTDKVMLPHRGVAATGNAFVGTIELSQNPIVKLDKSELVFNAPGADNPPPQMITVTNEGEKTLSQVSISISYGAGDGWLFATVNPDGGNKQIITNTIIADGLADGEYSATVTVFDGGADNTVSYAVVLNKGAAPASPTNLKAENTGNTLADVTLSWTDNSVDEQGFSIERKQGDGSWEVLTRTAPNQTTYTDEALSEATVYTYRIQAFSDGTVSSYSAEKSITVSGIPWITISSPEQGATVAAKSPCSIRWAANLVEVVRIRYSVDGGDTWNPVSLLGGVARDEEAWGNYLWTAPDITAQEVIISINDYMDEAVYAESGVFSIAPSAAVHPTVTKHGDGHTAVPTDTDVFCISGRRLPAAAAHARCIRKAQSGIYLVVSPSGRVRRTFIRDDKR